MPLLSDDDLRTVVQTRESQDDTLVRSYGDAAQQVVEDIVGPIHDPDNPRSMTYTLDGGWGAVLLPDPIQSVTSVTVDGAVSTGWVVNRNAGVVYAPDSGTFVGGRGSVVVVAVVGRDRTEKLWLAAMEEFRYLWSVGRRAARPGQLAAPIDGDAWQPSGFAVPRRVIELCGADERIPGIA